MKVRSYEDTFSWIVHSAEKATEYSKELQDYTLTFKTAVSQSNAAIDQMLVSCVKPGAVHSDVDLMKHYEVKWKELMEGLAPENLLLAVNEQLEKDLVPSVSRLCENYTVEASRIISSLRQSFVDLKAAEAQRLTTYDSYKDAGEAVQNAYDQKSPSLEDQKQKFIIRKQEAVEAHRQYNSARRVFATVIEVQLTAFEKVEGAKRKQLRDICAQLKEVVVLVESRMKTWSDKLREFVETFDSEIDANDFHEIEKLQDAIADLRYQAFTLPMDMASVLETGEVFSKKKQKGMKCCTVLEGRIGTDDELSVAQGEVLGILDEDNDRFKCVSINDTVGYVPKSVTESVKWK